MRKRPRHREVEIEALEVLAGLLGRTVNELDANWEDPSGADLIVAAEQVFVVEVKRSSSAATVADAARQAKEISRRMPRRTVPLVAVDRMGEAGRKACAEVGVGWFDLTGNADIEAPGVRILVEGKPPKPRSVGRPPNLFAPKSSRVARWLLLHPHSSITQRELAQQTELDEGFVSRLVSRLEDAGYLKRHETGAISAKEPARLLDAWHEVYQFSKHSVSWGHVASRSGDELLRTVGKTMSSATIEWAATGLAGAWTLTHFAVFRIVTIYLSAPPPPHLLQQLGWRPDERGANLWLVVPNDHGVFNGAGITEGIRCAHPVQIYLDLKAHPERAQEAAEYMRPRLLNGISDA